MQSIASTSPDTKHRAVLEYAGEIRFGPAYYSLTIDRIAFGGRFFGNKFLWSPDSRYFAVQEWETTNIGRGPRTHLLLIDLEAKRECELSRVEKGFVIPKSFENNKLIYAKDYFAPRNTSQFEIEFLSLDRWENLE